jgi:hypothetical protein
MTYMGYGVAKRFGLSVQALSATTHRYFEFERAVPDLAARNEMWRACEPSTAQILGVCLKI